MKRLLIIFLALLFSFVVISCDSDSGNDDKEDVDIEADDDEGIVDPCDPNPCGDNEVCIEDEDEEDGYVCECAEGYEWDDDEEACVEIPQCKIDRDILNPVDGYDSYFDYK